MSIAHRCCVTLAALLALSPVTARSQNLLTNGSFESGLSGWEAVASGNASTGAVGSCSLAAGAGTGCAYVDVGPRATVNSSLPGAQIRQVVTGLTVGQLYTASVLVRLSADVGLTASAQFGSPFAFTQIGQSCTVGATCLLSFTGAATATSQFFVVQGSREGVDPTVPLGRITFDQASVTAVTAVPEPASVLLLGSGLFAISFVAVRRKRTRV